ncbi:hypothetical protein [Desulfobacula phenolica]|uniref:Uncharacterized protein n=1 Tax=Desulfobacula phenolica TaxID=90732 RepID=A0A1H2DQR1_9BACT|nr:hypothetical protein [Desulfobacula phenolica]SDT84698.1 hypothetical protein SAMN04487931_101352 [Desulfobacula phenolica]
MVTFNASQCEGKKYLSLINPDQNSIEHSNGWHLGSSLLILYDHKITINYTTRQSSKDGSDEFNA